MWAKDERHAIDQVRQRLADRFPDLPPDRIRSMVEEAHARYDGPVRDYVPLLVERECRERLVAMLRDPLAAAG